MHARPLTLAALAALSLGVLQPAPAATGRDEAVALVKRAVAHIRDVGAERGYADISAGGITQPGGPYLVVYGALGDCLAHGANPAQVGKNLLEQIDIEGRFFVKERLLMAQVMPQGFWHEHKQANLLNKRIEQRLMYCERLADTTVCSGVRR